ncbi:MAG: T9SS type A sorting domain-containing protein [Bacteroidales bacterium]|nr:T9SS type A sorting domain-containing protein [Bacteroidales bacterium]
MKKTIFTLSILFIGITAMSQSDIVPLGGTATGSGGSATYTIGQPAIQRIQNGNTYIIEGVQQPYEIQTVGVDDFPQIVLNAVVYPNPTDNIVQLKLNGYEIPDGGLTARLYDGNGRLLQTVTVSDDLTAFGIGQYSSGSYLLDLLDGKRKLKTFKIIRR